MVEDKTIYIPYTPRNPYILATGNYRGKSLEKVAIQYPEHFSFIYSHVDLHSSLTDEYDKHVLWVHAQLHRTGIDKKCSFCKKKLISYFGYINSGDEFTLSPEYLYCDSCEKTEKEDGVKALPLSLSSLKFFSEGHLKRDVLPMFRKWFDMPERFSDKSIYKYFLEHEIKLLIKQKA